MFRFRRTLQIAPGLRINFSKSGASVSLGPRGASITIGQRGTYANVGIPGTGVSYRTRIDSSERQSRRSSDTSRQNPTAEPSAPHSRDHQNALEKETAPTERQRRRRQDADGDSGKHQRSIGKNHLKSEISDAHTARLERLQDFDIKIDRNGRLVITRRDGGAISATELKNLLEHRRDDIETLLRDEADQINGPTDLILGIHLASPDPSAVLVDDDVGSNQFTCPERSRSEQEDILEEAFNSIDWPRETLISFQISDNGTSVPIDVDLPEVEDLPPHTASVADTLNKLLISEKTNSELRREYAIHIHGIIFRVATTALSAVPSLNRAVVSGFSQRPDRRSGTIRDEFLVSVEITRSGLDNIDFNALNELNPVDAISHFNPVREMSTTGTFKPIEPL